MKRLLWLDIAKGLAILWVVYFHFFRTYFEHGRFPPPDWSSLAAGLTTFLGIAWLQVSGLGFHAVGVFIILSGWALMQSTARRAESDALAWGAWYRSRFLRLYPMYWVAHLVYLVSPFVVRPEQDRWPHCPEPARPPLYEYRDELLLPESRLVVFRHADPVLPAFSSAVLGGKKTRARGIFCSRACAVGFLVALPDARRLSAERHVDPGRLCDLPAAGICPGHGAGNVAQPVDRAGGTVFSRRHGLGGRIRSSIRRRSSSIKNGYAYIFVDFATGACCFLEVVGVAGIIARFRRPAKVFGLVGAFSYGVYLVHQPYVIWLGLRIREQPLWMFLLITAATLAVLSAWGIALEKATNTLLDKIIPKKESVT